jgi:hypothetical protein
MQIEERIEQLEKEVAAIKIIFQTATGFDPNRAEDLELVWALIEENPGLSQTGVCCAARTRYSLSRQRTIEILRLGVAKFWRVEAGSCNALLYYPSANRTLSDSQGTTHCDSSIEVRQASKKFEGGF